MPRAAMQEACQRGVIDPRGPTLAAFSQLRYLVAHGHLRVLNVSLPFRAPHSRQAQSAGVAGGCTGVLEAIRACHRVTRANHGGHANFMVRHKHHLRDARKRLGADARRAGQPVGMAPA